MHIGGDTYATRTHDSLKISNGKWCWWSREYRRHECAGLSDPRGGTFLSGCRSAHPWRIAPCAAHARCRTAPLLKTEFTLPPKHADNRRVFAYLRSRGIDAEIINHCIKHGQLYEDAERHNCVFVGYEHGKPAYGALRGTLSDTTFAGEVPGSDKRFSFAVPLRAGGKTLCVFEAAIDALSYLTLLKLRGQDWRSRQYAVPLRHLSATEGWLHPIPRSVGAIPEGSTPAWRGSCCAWTTMNRGGRRLRPFEKQTFRV